MMGVIKRMQHINEMDIEVEIEEAAFKLIIGMLVLGVLIALIQLT